MKKLLFVLITLFTVMLLYSCRGENTSGVTTFNLSVPDPVDSYIYNAAAEFVKRVEQYSSNTIKINISANGSLYGGDSSAGIKQLSSGALDIVILSTSLYSSFNPAFNIISVPFLFDNQKQLVDYLNSDIGTSLMTSVSNMNITCVGSWTRSFRKITSSKGPINTPDDLKGFILRVPNNTLYVSFFSECGATCTPMNFSEVYNALQLKTLDGQENPIDVPFSNKFWEVQKYISGTDHMADAWLVGINSKKFDSLTQAQKDAFIKAGKEVQEWNVQFMEQEDKTGLEVLIENGMEYNEVSPQDRNEFIKIAKKLYSEFEKLVGDSELFRKTIDFCGKSM